MKTNFDIWKWLMPLALLAAACGHDDLVAPDIPEEEPSTPYVELRIAMPANASETRSYPTGGEEGDGRERGLENEDKVHDINVFFYLETNGKGMDSPVNTRILKHIFYNIDDPSDSNNTPLWTGDRHESDSEEENPYFEKNYLVLRFECSGEELKQVEQTGIDFLVVANVGLLQNKTYLGDLLNLKLGQDTNAWTKDDVGSKDASKVNYFLMSTAYNKNYSYGGLSTGSNKITKGTDRYLGNTTLQRMYARIDLWYDEKTNVERTDDKKKVKELKYSISDTGNKVFLTNVLPVNVMQEPSYVFKKVTSDLSSFTIGDFGNYSYMWGGKESPYENSVNDLPSNYVMEWHTLDKNKDGATGDSKLEEWYGNTAVLKVKEFIVQDIANAENSNDNGKISAYFDYKPSTSDPGFECDHVSVISYANENTHPTDCFHSNYLTGMVFRAVYVPEKIYGGFREDTDSEGKTVLELIEVEATVKPDIIYRFSPSKSSLSEKDCIYFSRLDVLKKYQELYSGDVPVVTKFDPCLHDGQWGFICYYNLWLRHYNNDIADPQTTYPMEYATVRNNIYRVKVSFNGPGDPTPTMREPDTMQARIFVRKWNFREEKNPLDF